jgi:hypothetical protein
MSAFLFDEPAAIAARAALRKDALENALSGSLSKPAPVRSQ